MHCTIAVTAYLGPLDPYRIQVTLLVKDDSPHYERECYGSARICTHNEVSNRSGSGNAQA